MEGWFYLKKVLIVYTNAGAGHRRAAEALFQASQRYFPSVSATVVDTLDFATDLFKRTYPQTYLVMVNRVPRVWGLAYRMLDIRPVDRVARNFRRITNSRHCKKFEDFILKENPDIILTTHFLPNEIISAMKRHGKIRGKLITCITDFYPHAFWRDSGVDCYITPDPDLTPRLLKLGIPKSKIMPLGIPIDPVFSDPINRNQLEKQLGLVSHRLTILIASGGFGVGPVEELITELVKIPEPLQLMIVCGKNAKLKSDLEKYTAHPHHRMILYGFVNNMHELMSVADVMITKSGGLTTTEAIAKCLPMIVLNPIPGQELSNCEYIVSHGGGIEADDALSARKFIEELLKQPEKLHYMKENLEKLGRPDSARRILDYINQKFS